MKSKRYKLVESAIGKIVRKVLNEQADTATIGGKTYTVLLELWESPNAAFSIGKLGNKYYEYMTYANGKYSEPTEIPKSKVMKYANSPRYKDDFQHDAI